MEEANDITTKLLTLINVSATRSLKRQRLYDALAASEPKKLNKRKATRIAENGSSGTDSQSERTLEAAVATQAPSESEKDHEETVPDDDDADRALQLP